MLLARIVTVHVGRPNKQTYRAKHLTSDCTKNQWVTKLTANNTQIFRPTKWVNAKKGVSDNPNQTRECSWKLYTRHFSTILTYIQGVSKTALQWYSKCYCVADVTKTFTLKRVERWIVYTPLATQHLEYNCKALFETPCITSGTATISGKTRCVLLHCDSSKHCTCPLNKFI
jgi:hypothetical protein